ncbi:hypothetical protein DAPPUDRAFT_321553 [Daphnia pulex]|uniref:Uncharacterized protein n=1 Tax=Daphnia pulex TaxID=6669 RepID=E9GT01_DAPPU|nr:hypothetical protein DAPPUDRAFT_321553 [Daphnia pulex]|eukprot:EFX77357.1 hypothetical protein DAPPUDRAFT_321553 [Daphnia pulex]
MGPEDEANRSPPRKKPCGSETQLPPVIIKLTDGKSTFMTMHIAERMRIQNEIIGAVGEPRESTVLMGGDLAVVTHNNNQQADLMALKNILGRPVLCSLPNSASAYRTGAVQAELKNLRDAVIPSMNKEIKTLTVYMAAVNGKLKHIDARFDDVLKRQEENAKSQTSRFDKLNHVMNSLMDTLSISKKLPPSHHKALAKPQEQATRAPTGQCYSEATTRC